MQVRTIALAVAMVICGSLGFSVAAHEQFKGDLRLAHPWVVVAGDGEALAYVIEITNGGKVADRLIGASLDAAGEGQLRSRTVGEGRKFNAIEGGIAIGAGQSVEIAPGATQIYFPGLKSGLVEGKIAKGTLVFEKAGAVPTDFMVEPASAAEADLGTNAAEHGAHKPMHHHHH